MKILEMIYNEMHMHMRDAYKRRDQMIMFYILLLSALFAGWDKVSNIKLECLTALFVFGFCLIFLLIQYRRWHIKYNNSITLYQYLIYSNLTAINLKICEDNWNRLNEKRSLLKLINPVNSIESTTYITFAVLVGITFDLLVKESKYGIQFIIGGTIGSILSSVINVLIIAFTSLIIAGFLLQNAENFNPKDWDYRWLIKKPTGSNTEQ